MNSKLVSHYHQLAGVDFETAQVGECAAVRISNEICEIVILTKQPTQLLKLASASFRCAIYLYTKKALGIQ